MIWLAIGILPDLRIKTSTDLGKMQKLWKDLGKVYKSLGGSNKAISRCGQREETQDKDGTLTDMESVT